MPRVGRLASNLFHLNQNSGRVARTMGEIADSVLPLPSQLTKTRSVPHPCGFASCKGGSWGSCCCSSILFLRICLLTIGGWPVRWARSLTVSDRSHRNSQKHGGCPILAGLLHARVGLGAPAAARASYSSAFVY
jgi:hypothetical protein